MWYSNGSTHVRRLEGLLQATTYCLQVLTYSYTHFRGLHAHGTLVVLATWTKVQWTPPLACCRCLMIRLKLTGESDTVMAFNTDNRAGLLTLRSLKCKIQSVC